MAVLVEATNIVIVGAVEVIVDAVDPDLEIANAGF